MTRVQELMEEKRPYVYSLDLTMPKVGGSKLYRVSMVFENESGHFPSGGGDVAPWYWDDATCERKNAELGKDKEEVNRIVISSMR